MDRVPRRSASGKDHSDGVGERGGRMVPVWIAIGAVLSLFIGSGAGVLAWLGGQVVPLAVLTGCAAFGATLTLVVMIINSFR